MKRYFAYISIPMLVGILLAYHMDMEQFSSYLLLGLLIISSWVLAYILEDYSLLAASLFLILGVLILGRKLNIKSYKYMDRPRDIVGLVDQVQLEDQASRLVVKIKSLDRQALRTSEYTSLRVEGPLAGIRPGCLIAFRTKLGEPSHFKNPRGFNYQKHLMSRSIFTTGQIRSDKISLLDGSPSLGYQLREKFASRLDKALDKNIDLANKKLLKTMILGENFLEDETRQAYTNLGLAHILAVSGLHIGIISSLLVLLLGFLKLGKRSSRLVSLIFIWAYAYLINFPISLVRANLMISLYYISKILYLPYDYKNSIFFASFILLLINPLNILSLGFILSLASVLSLAYLEPVLRTYLKVYFPKGAKFLSPILAVNLGLLPLIAHYFNTVQILSLLSNLLIVPLLSLVLNLALLSLIFGPKLGLLNILINTSLNIQAGLVGLLGQIPLNNLSLASPSLPMIFAYYILLLGLVYRFRLGSGLKDLASILSINLGIYCLGLVLNFIFFPSLEVRILDVGQGDCILIRERGKNYLIDSGGEAFGDYSIGENVLRPYMLSHGIGKIRALFISHFHDDHSKAILDLLDLVEIENIYASYREPSSPSYRALSGTRPGIEILSQGQRLKLSKDLEVTVLSPPALSREKNENNLSLVLRLDYRGQTMIFTGDAEEKVEKNLLEKGLVQPVDILKLGHHGSKTSSSQEFLDHLSPSLALVSVGRGNTYGHPHPDVLARLGKTQLVRTDLDGHIGLELDGRQIRLSSYQDKFSLEAWELAYYFSYGLGLGLYIYRDIYYYRTRKSMLL